MFRKPCNNISQQFTQCAFDAASLTATIPCPCDQIDNGLDHYSAQRKQSLSNRLTALYDNIANGHDKLSKCIADCRNGLRNCVAYRYNNFSDCNSNASSCCSKPCDYSSDKNANCRAKRSKCHDKCFHLKRH